MNPKAARRHLYFRTTGSLLTKSEILSLPKVGEATPIDAVLEAWKRRSLPWESFAAWFEREASKRDPPNAG
jgi:hypothetical protein